MMSKRLFLNKVSRRATMGLMGLSLAGLLVSCNSHPVSFAQSEGSVVVTEDRSPDSAASVDILWMIDNSGSMCEIQKSLRVNFDNFIHQITEKNIDFQMGVTTTDMAQDHGNRIEPLSRPGYLQARPQPVPTGLPGCSGTPNTSDPTKGFEPVRTNIALAISCSKDPAKWAHLENVTNDDIAKEYPTDEELDGGHPEGHPYKLFPTTPDGKQPRHDTPEDDNPYRLIAGDNKMVLHSEDYRNEVTGEMDEESIENMRADFACMSLVGTTGSGFEKGLAAAIHAISPEMTGGTLETPRPDGEQAPNHGLLRDNANFALVLVTDENDCTDYGTFAGSTALPNTTPFYDEDGKQIKKAVELRTACGDTACAMWNSPALAGITPLISPEKLAQRLKDNLAESKDKEINEDAIVVTSIHGEYRRYGEDYPKDNAIQAAIDATYSGDQVEMAANIEAWLNDPNSCGKRVDRGPYAVIAEQISCTLTGAAGDTDAPAEDTPTVAFSGDRYDRFLRYFAADRVLPKVPSNPDAHMPGLICDPASMGATLGDIGELIAGSTSQCIAEPPHECRVDEDCPAFAFGDQEPTCRQFGRSTKKYCDSGLQLRLFIDKDGGGKTFSDLQSHPYCMPESIDSTMTPGGCVIDPSNYQINDCPGRDDAINLEWVDEDSFDYLAGYSVKLVYSVVPEPQDETTD